MFDLTLDPKIQDTLTIFLAIVIEAVPFIVLGVLVSAVLSAFVKDKWLLKLRGDNRFGSHLISSLLGMLFPVCECGNVPVTRELLGKGFSPSQAVSFYLGAPILNIVVIASTISAFGSSPLIVLARVLGGLAIAVVIGLIVSYHPRQTELLTPTTAALCEVHKHQHAYGIKVLLSKRFVKRFLNEFLSMLNLLIFGAALAAITQLWVPRDFIYLFASNPLLSILAMIALALILSVCSTVDAFIALAFVGQFSPAAIVAFLIFGPMIDFKAISMLLTTFKPRLVALMVFLVTSFTLIISLSLSLGGY